MDAEKAKLIILNGVSSAGKSSIAKALQEKLDSDFLHFQMDTFWSMLPPGKLARNFPNMKYAIMDSVAALLKHGHNVIFDVVCPPDVLGELLKPLQEYQPYLVTVKASLDVLREREKLRPDRDPGRAEAQYAVIYKNAVSDLEVDTSSLTADQSAAQIVEAYKAQPGTKVSPVVRRPFSHKL